MFNLDIFQASQVAQRTKIIIRTMFTSKFIEVDPSVVIYFRRATGDVRIEPILARLRESHSISYTASEFSGVLSKFC